MTSQIDWTTVVPGDAQLQATRECFRRACIEISALQATLPALPDASGGTPQGTLGAVPASYDQAYIQNAFATLTARINALSALHLPPG